MSKCEWCGKEIESKTRKFCNDKCKNDFSSNKQKEIRKNVKHYCIQCGKEIIDYVPNTKFCSEECHETYLINKNNKKYEGKEYCTCAICGWRSRVLTQHLMTKHGISFHDYMEKYNKTLDECMLKSSRDAWGEKIKGENNGAYNHGGRFSPYSKKFIKYDNLTDEEKEEKISSMYKNLSETLTDGTGRLRTQVEYWTKQGFTEDEAIDKISKLQVTFSLEKCIEKYGEEGQKRWKERQEKWLNTLYDKPPEEIERIHRSKFKNTGYSDISQNLFWRLLPLVQHDFSKIYFATYNVENKVNVYNNYEYCLILPDRNVFFLDFYIKDINKCIEFDGDYWHGDKKGNKTKDEIRTQLIEESGIQVFHIKERDFRTKPNKCLMDCMSFIYSK